MLGLLLVIQLALLMTVGNRELVNLDNENHDSENDVEEDDNETVASKSVKGTNSSKSGGGTRMKSLYDHWKEDYDDNSYDDDDECEYLTEEKLALYDAYDIRVHGHARRK